MNTQRINKTTSPSDTFPINSNKPTSLYDLFLKHIYTPVLEFIPWTKKCSANSKSETEKLTEKLLSLTKEEDQPKLLNGLKDEFSLSRAKSLFLTQHIYERMKTFGHQLSFNQKGELILKTSQAHHLGEFVKDRSSIDWVELKATLIRKNITIEVKGTFENGRYKNLDLINISAEELKEYLTSNIDNILLISHDDLTLNELTERNIISTRGIINQNFQYTEQGLAHINLHTPVFLNSFNKSLNGKSEQLNCAITHYKLIREIHSRHEEFKNNPEAKNYIKSFIINQIKEFNHLLKNKNFEILSIANRGKKDSDNKISMMDCENCLQICTYVNYRQQFPHLKDEEIELMAQNIFELRQMQKYQFELLMLLNVLNDPNLIDIPIKKLESALININEAIQPNTPEKLQNLGVNTFPDKITTWKNLKPYQHVSPQENFTVDIIVHSPSDALPGVFEYKAHASIKITTPNGEVYSIGFQPKDPSTNFKLREGKLESPDHFIFMPKKNYHQHTTRYTLPDASSFHELISWIEEIQGTPNDGNFPLLYHPTHHNCAAFVKTIRNKVVSLGGKTPAPKRKVSMLTRIKTIFEKSLLNFFISAPGINKLTHWIDGIKNFKGIKNYNITHMKDRDFYLPIDLILDIEAV